MKSVTYLSLANIQAQHIFQRTFRIRTHFKSHPEKQKKLYFKKKTSACFSIFSSNINNLTKN